MRSLLRPFAIVLSFACASAYADRIEYFARGEDGRLIDFGSGADGAFVNGPVQTGISVAGSVITFNTSVKSVYEFSSFTLGSTFTLNAAGAYPLVLRIAGETTIAGTLQSNGGTGGTAAAASPTSTGGTAGAGGGAGGIGGERSPDTAATIGSPASLAHAAGGLILANVGSATTQNAGGGGCHGTDAAFLATGGSGATGTNPGTCTLSQALIADRFESIFLGTNPGGAGGGGGATQSVGGNGINGAGGGGGGGAIRIASVGTLTISGTVNARGGAGGLGVFGNTDYGASGGGGSGGSIWIQAGNTVTGAGTLDVTRGNGGTDATSIGGNGSRGVVRIDAGKNSFTGTVSPKGFADQAYDVYPVTTEFTLSGGPACGRIQAEPLTPQESTRDFAAFAAWSSLLFAYFGFRKLKSRVRAG